MNSAPKDLVTFRHVVPGSVVLEQTSESEVVSHQFLGGTLTISPEAHPQLFKDLDRLTKVLGSGVSYDRPEAVPNVAPEQKQASEQVKDGAATAAARLASAVRG